MPHLYGSVDPFRHTLLQLHQRHHPQHQRRRRRRRRRGSSRSACTGCTRRRSRLLWLFELICKPRGDRRQAVEAPISGRRLSIQQSPMSRQTPQNTEYMYVRNRPKIWPQIAPTPALSKSVAALLHHHYPHHRWPPPILAAHSSASAPASTRSVPAIPSNPMRTRVRTFFHAISANMS